MVDGLVKRFAVFCLRSDIVAAVADEIEKTRRLRRYEQFREEYDIHPDAEFNGREITLYGDGDIRIGKGSYIGGHSGVQAVEGQSVNIGKHCAISHQFRIYTGNRVADQDFRETKKSRQGDVNIGDYSWIGSNVFITEGTTIGENAVVGAHSVVTDDLPPHSICVGAPARVKQFKSYLSDDERARLAQENFDVLSDQFQDQFDHY